MASVLQRGKKKGWYAVFRDLEGRQKWRRLDALDRRKAQAAADLLEATAQRKKSAQALRKASATSTGSSTVSRCRPRRLKPTRVHGWPRKSRKRLIQPIVLTSMSF